MREVAEEAARRRVVFLGEQAEIVAEREQFLEVAAGIVGAADEGEVVDEPEAAGQEGAFVAGEALDEGLFGGALAVDEWAVGELALDRLDGAAHARVVWWEEAGERDQ